MFYLLKFIVVVLLLSGCGEDIVSQDSTNDVNKTTIDDNNITDESNSTLKTASDLNATFAQVHKMLLTQCLSCHGDSGQFTLGTRTNVLLGDEAYSNIMQFVTSSTSSVLLDKVRGIGHGGGLRLSEQSEDYALLFNWITHKMPRGSLNDDINISTFKGYTQPATALKISNAQHRNGVGVVQGKACIACHNSQAGSDLIVAGGTLYSYINTPDARYYQDLSRYVVELVRDDGKVVRAKTYSDSSFVGQNSFYIAADGSLPLNSAQTFYVRVLDASGRLVNRSGYHNSNGQRDCNRCHTQMGGSGAPGRILGAH